MDKSPGGSVGRHGRNISHPLPRRSTKGPLDDVDQPSQEPQTPPSRPTSQRPISSQRPDSSRLASPSSSIRTQSAKPRVNLRFLQERAKYHQLPVDEIPEPILNSQNQPPLETPLATLLEQGHFRRAAETAATDLLNCSPEETVRLFQLLYTRLACLVLINRPDLAVHEAAALTDFLARPPPDASEIVSAIPWELRLLLVRLQALTANDNGRRSIMSLYSLAAEVRAHLKDAKTAGDVAAAQEWSARLRDLGLKVADTLVEMGELETATRHLGTLVNIDEDELEYRKALLRLRVGDITGAQICMDEIKNSDLTASLQALLQATDGDFSQALTQWQTQLTTHPNHPLFASNLAVALLYTGRLSQARSTLEELATTTSASPTLLFNLATIYELSGDRASTQKQALALRTAAQPPHPHAGGWERSTPDFKI